MKLPLKWIAAAVVLALLGAGVTRALSNREAQKKSLEQHQAQQKVQAVVELGATDTARAARVELVSVLPISGPVKAVRSAVVKARVPGELMDLVVREGDSVKAGQVIARIDATESQARVRQALQQAESAKGQVDIARRSYDNNRSLVEQGFISRTALDTSSASLASAEANYRAAQAAADVLTKSLEDTVLRAPISGQISQRLAQPGERVAVDTRIVEIVDLGALEIEVNLSASDSLAVRLGQVAQLQVEGASQAFEARVTRINPSASAANRAVVAYLAVAPGTSLRQGLFTQGSLAVGKKQVLAVPLDAVRTDKPQPYVQWVSAGTVAHQNVTLGARGDYQGTTYVEVSPLPEATVVLRGEVGPLREGTPVKLAQVAP